MTFSVTAVQVAVLGARSSAELVTPLAVRLATFACAFFTASTFSVSDLAAAFWASGVWTKGRN